MSVDAPQMPGLVSRQRPIVISRALGKVVVAVHGALDESRVETLHRVLVDLVDNQGNLDVVVDLRDLRFTHGALDGALDDVAARARRRGGVLRASSAHGDVLREIEARSEFSVA